MMKTNLKRTVLSLLLAGATLAPLAVGYAAEGDVPFRAAVKASADPALHDSLPEAIKKPVTSWRAPTPIRPRPPSMKRTTKRWPGVKST